jgi:6-phosphogluconolactonase (cycloisomerase 2 family)
VAGTDDNAIATFKRNRHNGRLKFINAKVDGQGGVEGLDQTYETTVSPNGRNVYVTAYGSDSVATFKRNRRNGRLQFLNAKFDGANLPLGDPYDVVASRDGKNVYVAFYNNGTNSGVDTFKRNRHNGKLQFVNAKRDGVGNVDHVAGIWRLAITSDDRSIYVAAFDEPSVGIFKRHR